MIPANTPSDLASSSPHPGQVQASGAPNALERQRISSVRQDLARAREELASLQSLVESLPEIFEQKFQERMAPLLGQQERLLHQNSALRQNLLQSQVADGNIRSLNSLHQRPRLGSALRHAFGFEDRCAS